jgi:hypothetical protein
MEFVYTDLEKTKGYINLTEFSDKKRCPEEGEFSFGIDFSPKA